MKEHASDLVEKKFYDIPSFKSVTRDFLSSEASSKVACPRCGTMLDFQKDIEWQGPDHFTCGNCERIISKSLILNAMRDLGLT